MQSIVLATINARYAHAALGLRYLKANLGALASQAVIREFISAQSPSEIAEALLAESPRVLGFGVYIWNVRAATQVVETVKRVRPDICIVLGGAEMGYEYEGTELFSHADYLILGEGEAAFAHLAEAVLSGNAPAEKVIAAPRPSLSSLTLPYSLYDAEDLANRCTYVEASRGCPFQCDFCLSALEPGVREFPLDWFLDAMENLIARGARQIRFVDRTFNIREERAEAILRFFLSHWREGLRVHFEIMPDRLSKRLLDLMAEFPPGGIHLEVGVQTFDPGVQEAIARRQCLETTEANLRFLRTHTGALLHADLVAGLPGESWASFAAGFDRLLGLEPHEVQVGILKRLKGAPISRHAAARKMIFASEPPYEVLQTDLLDFFQLQRIKRFARYFDLYVNAGNFPRALELLWRIRPSRFDAFMALSDALWSATHRTHELSLTRLAERLYAFLEAQGNDAPETIADAIAADIHRIPGRKGPLLLKSGRSCSHKKGGASDGLSEAPG